MKKKCEDQFFQIYENLLSNFMSSKAVELEKVTASAGDLLEEVHEKAPHAVSINLEEDDAEYKVVDDDDDILPTVKRVRNR